MGVLRRSGSVAGHIVLCLSAIVLFAASIGCSLPHPIKTYECVTAYDRMSDRFEPEGSLSLVYVPIPTALKAYRGIIREFSDTRVAREAESSLRAIEQAPEP